MAWAGLGSRRADTAHAPQLVSDSFGVSVSSNSALRALQGVVETSRILRSLCEVAEKSLCALLLDCAVRKFVLNKC